MDDRAAPITGNYARLLTVLSKEVLTVSQFGMVISDAVYTEGDGRERSSGSGGSNAKPVAGDWQQQSSCCSSTLTTRTT